jgi:aminoglycoside phosphotransferase (APT) family kinase protein
VTGSRTAELRASLPSEEALRDALAAVLHEDADQIRIETREVNGSGTFPKERVVCRLPEGDRHSYFCKYEAPRAASHGHRRGVRYEAEVYRRVLSLTNATTPRFVGTHAGTGGTWLVLAFVDGSERLSDRPSDMVSAARWLGDFHATLEGHADASELSFVTRYDVDYYRGWARRTLAHAHQHHRATPALAALCERFMDDIASFAALPATVVHGEFTIHNVLVRDGTVYPIDWESAAVGPGEVDLMCLVDRWPADVVENCARAYSASRYGTQPPTDFASRMSWAELYLHLRWLGEHPDLMLHKKRVWRLERLEEIADEWGIGG